MKIINVFKTHFDIGFTDLSENMVSDYGKKMLHEVLDVFEKTCDRPVGKRFVWTMAAWPLIKSLENASENDCVRAQKYINNGQLVIHALPYTIHTESLGKGDLNHLFNDRDYAVEKYGFQMPISAKMTDVPGHTIALVGALYNNGVKFLHLGCNPASTYPNVPTMFWWENNKGQRVLTFYNNTYGSNMLPPSDWKYPVWLSLQQTNDNLGPQDSSILDKIESKINKEMPGAEVLFGSLDDFYNEIIKCDLSDLPVIKTDLGDTWIHGVGSYPKEVGLIRRARNIVENSHLSLDDEKTFYENSLLFSEHTWGVDIKTFLTWQRSYEKDKFNNERNLERYQFVEKSWNEQRDRAVNCSIVASKYGNLYEEFPKSCLEDDKYRIDLIDGVINILNKNTKRIIKLDYEYRVIGTQEMTDFLRSYLTRFYCWALSDFGRDSYGEVSSEKYGIIFNSSNINCGHLEVNYDVSSESYEKYGNAKSIKFIIGIVEGNIQVRLLLNDKQASPYIECGDLFFKTNCIGNKYSVKKIDYTLDIRKDICENANQIMFAVSNDASIDDVHINPIDTPLVSFGESSIFKFNGGKYRKPKENSIVFNLFNNQWGTNFPQWIEGDFIFDYIINID